MLQIFLLIIVLQLYQQNLFISVLLLFFLHLHLLLHLRLMHCILQHSSSPERPGRRSTEFSGSVHFHCILQHSVASPQLAVYVFVMRNRPKPLCFTVFQLPERSCSSLFLIGRCTRNHGIFQCSSSQEGAASVHSSRIFGEPAPELAK